MGHELSFAKDQVLLCFLGYFFFSPATALNQKRNHSEFLHGTSGMDVPQLQNTLSSAGVTQPHCCSRGTPFVLGSYGAVMLRFGDRPLEQLFQAICCISPFVFSLQGTGAGLWVPRLWRQRFKGRQMEVHPACGAGKLASPQGRLDLSRLF